MKKHFRSIFLFSIALSLASGAFISVTSFLSKTKNTIETSAADSMNPPEYTSTYSSPGQNWAMSNDPDAGKSSDYSVYSTSLNSSTAGFSSGVQSMSISTGKDGYLKPYIQLTTQRTKEFRAMYVPFKFQFTLPAHIKATYNLSFNIYAGRSNADGGGADYSTELFHYGETPQTPTSWFYHQGDFTNSTGRGYSQYRVAGETVNSHVSEDYSKTITIENLTGSTAVKNVYFGMFCYMESSSYSGAFTGKITTNSCTYTFEYALATLDNNGTIQHVYTPSEAVSKFNAASGQTMTLISDIDFSSYGNPIYTASGTINLSSYDILLGSHLMYVSASITFTGTTTAEIKGSAAHSVLFLNAAATVNLSGYVAVKSENTTTQTARAILVSHENADLYLNQDAFVYSNYYGVQVDNGTFHCQGRIFAGTGTNADVPYAIYVGSSNDALKNIYLYGTNCRVLKLHTANLAKTRIYAKSGTTSYKASFNVTISISNSYALGDIVVRNVTSSGSDKNDNKFILSDANYQIYTEGTNKTIQYKKYNVTYTLENCTTDGAAFASRAENLSFTITPNEGYLLPDSISITRGDETLVQNTHYTYNNTTGDVVLTSTYITNNIKVVAYGVRLITIRFLNASGEEIADSISHAGPFTLTLPTISEVIRPAYHSTIYWYLNADLTGTHFGGGYSSTVYNPHDYYAKFEQTNKDLVDYFVGVKLHFDVDVIDINNNSDTGACRGETGYYEVAKSYYNSMPSASKAMLCENAEYANGRNRFVAWAHANGEDLNFQTHAIVQQSSRSFETSGTTKNNTLILAIIITTVLTSGSCLGLIIFKKKRHI